MPADKYLLDLAFHAERVAARREAARNGVSHEAALRVLLEKAAGAAGLEALLRHRSALREAAAVKTAARLEARKAALALKMRRHQGPVSAWKAWFDGSAHPNPGRCGIGGVVIGPEGERIEISRGAGYGNSSEAEYMALIAVLEAAHAAGARELTVHGDSRGVIEDAAGSLDAGAPSLHHLRSRVAELMAEVGVVRLHWLPRHKNVEADALSQRAVAKNSSADIEEP